MLAASSAALTRSPTTYLWEIPIVGLRLPRRRRRTNGTLGVSPISRCSMSAQRCRRSVRTPAGEIAGTGRTNWTVATAVTTSAAKAQVCQGCPLASATRAAVRHTTRTKEWAAPAIADIAPRVPARGWSRFDAPPTSARGYLVDRQPFRPSFLLGPAAGRRDRSGAASHLGTILGTNLDDTAWTRWDQGATGGQPSGQFENEKGPGQRRESPASRDFEVAAPTGFEPVSEP